MNYITHSIPAAIEKGNRTDIFIPGRESKKGFKLSLQGKTVEDSMTLFNLLGEWLMTRNIAFKVGTSKRISHPNKPQARKVMTIYIPDNEDLFDIAERVYGLTMNYKGWYNIATPTSYEHYAGCVFFRNDRDEFGEYIAA